MANSLILLCNIPLGLIVTLVSLPLRCSGGRLLTVASVGRLGCIAWLGCIGWLRGSGGSSSSALISTGSIARGGLGVGMGTGLGSRVPSCGQRGAGLTKTL